MEDYKQKYEEALKNINKIKTANKDNKELVDFIEFEYPELKESEDERIRKELINFFSKGAEYDSSTNGIKDRNIIAWLEKQDIKLQEYIDEARNKKDFYCEGKEMSWNDMSINVRKHDYPYYFKGDLDCYPFNIEKQCEQKTTNKIQPRFKVSDWVTDGIITFQIAGIEDEWYIADDHSKLNFSLVNQDYHLWTIQDAKDGDVLAYNDGHGNDCIELIKSITDKKIEFWFCLSNGNHYEVFDGIVPYTNLVSREDATPATKEQRDTLMKAMADAGWEFDFDKKELKKIDNEEVNGEDYGIDSLYHAQRILEKTLGSVDGYQSDDGILEHKCAISAVKKLYEQKYAWSEEDDRKLQLLIAMCDETKGDSATYSTMYLEMEELKSWLKSLKERYDWKPSDEQMEALRRIKAAIAGDGKIYGQLNSLYEDLKKLKGE